MEARIIYLPTPACPSGVVLTLCCISQVYMGSAGIWQGVTSLWMGIHERRRVLVYKIYEFLSSNSPSWPRQGNMARLLLLLLGTTLLCPGLPDVIPRRQCHDIPGDLYQFSARRLNDSELVTFDQYRGKVSPAVCVITGLSTRLLPVLELRASSDVILVMSCLNWSDELKLIFCHVEL